MVDVAVRKRLFCFLFYFCLSKLKLPLYGTLYEKKKKIQIDKGNTEVTLGWSFLELGKLALQYSWPCRAVGHETKPMAPQGQELNRRCLGAKSELNMNLK